MSIGHDINFVNFRLSDLSKVRDNMQECNKNNEIIGAI